MSKAEKPDSSWRERKKTIKHKWLTPFIFAEWLCEWVSYLIGRWAFLRILGHAGRLTILIAVIFYFTESNDRRKAKQYQAWQVINAAQGKPGSGGRIDALQELVKDRVPLTGVNVSNAYLAHIKIENAYLGDANLSGANLFRADLSGADLSNANLSGANLFRADLSGADLSKANLFGADLSNANLSGSDFFRANLSGADLSKANLSGAHLFSANLSEADLSNANLSGADLWYADLSGADLWYADLSGAIPLQINLSGARLSEANLLNIRNWQEVKSVEFANIYGVKNPPDGFIEWAKEHGAVSIEDQREWEKLLREKMQKTSKNSKQLNEEKR